MSCSGCASGRGHHNEVQGASSCCSGSGGCSTGGCNKLNVVDWLSDMELPEGQIYCDTVEVRFKNSRKEFYKNTVNLSLSVGDVVAVEATQGHDIGVVSLTGELVRIHLSKKRVAAGGQEIRKIYRKARAADVEKWREAQAMEESTMFKARTFALNHGLQMKISDVEYQGDKSKAVFYYTADGRVDFRELIKTLASQFGVRIEMRQIGTRQEASRLGGIGSCGRELCCSTWLTDFRAVTTSAARYQQLSLNPLKLAGQCGKLKCCLNYELDSYLDAVKDFPKVDNVKLNTKKGKAFHQKTDIFKRMMWFSYEDSPQNFVPMSVDRVKHILEMNLNAAYPEELIEEPSKRTQPVLQNTAMDFQNAAGQESSGRFIEKRRPKRPDPRNPSRTGKPYNRPNSKGGKSA